jgi:hypothetical protein
MKVRFQNCRSLQRIKVFSDPTNVVISSKKYDIHKLTLTLYTLNISLILKKKIEPQHIVPAIFVLDDDYNPNTAPEILICLNKVGKNVGLSIY